MFLSPLCFHLFVRFVRLYLIGISQDTVEEVCVVARFCCFMQAFANGFCPSLFIVLKGYGGGTLFIDILSLALFVCIRRLR